MKPIGTHNYWLYILTNAARTVLYIGVTSNLDRRIEEHRLDAEGAKKSFAGKYNCYHLLYVEHYVYIANAIAREKEIKKWSRAKKEALISAENPNWTFITYDN
jgi:putative endonuclease